MTNLDLWITPDGQLFIRHGEELYRRSHDVRWITEETAWYHRLKPDEQREVTRWLEAYEAVRAADPHLAVVQIRKIRGDREGTLTVERNFISILTGRRERGEVSKKRVDMGIRTFLQDLTDELNSQGFEEVTSGYAGDAFYNISVSVANAEEAAEAAVVMLEFSKVREP